MQARSVFAQAGGKSDEVGILAKEGHHPTDVSFGEAGHIGELGMQIGSEPWDDGFPPAGLFLAFADGATDLPSRAGAARG